MRRSITVMLAAGAMVGAAGLGGCGGDSVTATQPPAAGPTPVTATPDAPATTAAVGAQPWRPVYRLNEKGEWEMVAQAQPGSDEAKVAEARRLIAAGDPNRAINLLNPWLKENESSAKPLVPAALLARGDATTLAGDEFQALYDYEQILKFYPGCPEFAIAAERELEIGITYLRGQLRRGWFGLRWIGGEDVGVELLVRVQERVPGSRVAERAGIELADYYYRTRDLTMAAEAYEIFAKIYPLSAYRVKALQRQVYANIAKFKGPRYDSSSLTDAKVLIRRFMSLYPAQAQETGLDEALLNRIDESEALRMLEVSSWYLQRLDEAGARYTLRRLVRLHPKSAAAGKALQALKDRGWTLDDEPAKPSAGANP